MSLTATVTPGYTFAANEKLTYAKLNQLGQPTVALDAEALSGTTPWTGTPATLGELYYDTGQKAWYLGGPTDGRTAISFERKVPVKAVTVPAGDTWIELSTNAADQQLSGLVQVTFDSTDADKEVYLPAPSSAYAGRVFRLAAVRAATTGSRKITLKVGTHGAPVTGKVAARAAAGTLATALTDSADLTAAATTAQAALAECACDGTYWYVRV